MKKAVCALAAMLAIALLPWFTVKTASGEAEAERISVTMTVPKGREEEAFLLSDGYASTFMIFRKESVLRASFEKPAAKLVTVWEQEPEAVELRCYAGEELLLKTTLEVPYLSTVTDLPEGTTAAELVLGGKKDEAHLSELYAYGAGELPEDEYQWQMPASPDVLLVVAFPGDEYRCFGGLLPKLLSDGANVAVCYVADHSRERLEQAFRALWTLGVKNYPILLHAEGKLSLDYQILSREWKKSKPEKLLGEQLRAQKPKVVVAPSDEKTGTAEERLASEYAQAACKSTGAFQKLYLAQGGKNETVIENEPLPLYGNRTAYDVAKDLYKSIRSAAFFEYRVYESGAFSVVQGKTDSKHDSLFEGLSVELHPITVTPEPTAEPTEEPTEAPMEEPTEEPPEAPTAEPVTEQSAEPTETNAPDAAPKMTAEPTPAATQASSQKRGLFSCAGKEETPIPTAVPSPEMLVDEIEEVVVALTSAPTHTPLPTEEPTAVPEPTATPEPTEAPAPEPEPERFAGHFLADGEPEQFTMDRENGHWTFRDQSTDMEINRITTKDKDGAPQIYFIAHIWMRDNQHRSAFGHETRSGRTTGKAYGIARRYGAVLAITGDNMVNFDEAWELKSSLIRDGQVYMKKTGESVMAWNERTLNFDLFDTDTFTLDDLLERGYRDVYCFGPILVSNGEVTPRLSKHRLGGHNPRTGVGMVEPGHIVVIVVDGKNKGVATGMELEPFAELFRNEGCVTAYNLDGGMSTDIVFMGEHLRERDEKRNLPDMLLFGHTDLLPKENDPSPDHYETGVGENGEPIIIPKKH